jgi:hypothetical protein
MKRRICLIFFIIFISGMLFSAAPEIKIESFKGGDPVIKCMREIEPGVYTGKISLTAEILGPTDLIPEKNHAFEWFVLEGDTLIAESYLVENNVLSGRVLIDSKTWIQNLMIWDPEKFEVGLIFSENNGSGESVKIGFRVRNPGQFYITFRIKKYFSDNNDNLYYGIWEIVLGPIERFDYSHAENGKTFYTGVLNFSEVQLTEHNFPDVEPIEDPEPIIDPEPDPEPDVEPEPDQDPEQKPEEKKSFLEKIISAIINLFKIIFS